MMLTPSASHVEQALLLPVHSASESTMGRNSQDLDFQRHVRNWVPRNMDLLMFTTGNMTHESYLKTLKVS